MPGIKGLAWGLMPLFVLFSVGCTKEISVQSTVLREGLLYRTGENSPFSGQVIGKGSESRHTQTMIYRKSYKNGVLDGETFFYYPNGKIESIVPYTNGKIHGTLVCYWPSGKPKSRIQFENGLREEISGEMFLEKEGHPM